MKLMPKNWATFQHYKDRCPPWIKLHRDLLNDRAYMCLPTASKALAPMLWLLASESKDGSFDASVPELEFRLRMPVKDIEIGLKALVSAGFFVDASTMLAPCLQSAIPEREGETEKETEGKQRQKRASALPEDFRPSQLHYNLALSVSVNLDDEFVKFCDYHRAKGSTMKDWDAALRTWIRNAAEFNKRGPAPRMSQQQRLEENNRRAVEAFLQEGD